MTRAVKKTSVGRREMISLGSTSPSLNVNVGGTGHRSVGARPERWVRCIESAFAD